MWQVRSLPGRIWLAVQVCGPFWRLHGRGLETERLQARMGTMRVPRTERPFSILYACGTYTGVREGAVWRASE